MSGCVVSASDGPTGAAPFGFPPRSSSLGVMRGIGQPSRSSLGTTLRLRVQAGCAAIGILVERVSDGIHRFPTMRNRGSVAECSEIRRFDASCIDSLQRRLTRSCRMGLFTGVWRSRGVGRLLAMSPDPMTLETPTVIEQIAQIVGWLPKREVAAGDVRSGLVVIQAHATMGSLRRGDLLGFQAHVLRLKPSPLRTVLNRRVVQLVEDAAIAAGA